MNTMKRDLDQGLLRELECPVCIEYMQPPITFCQNGHNICNICKPKMHNCPTCRGSFLQARNLALENLANHAVYPCFYRKSGCQESFTLDQMSKHQNSCSFGFRSCPFSISKSINCTWRGPPANVLHHIKDKHKQKLFMTESVHSRLLDIHTDKEYSIAIHAFGEIFYCQFKVKDDCFFVAVVYIGPKINNRFKWEMCFSKPESFERIAVTSVAYNEMNNIDEIYESETCVKLHYSYVKRFMDSGKNMQFSVTISKVSENEYYSLSIL